MKTQTEIIQGIRAREAGKLCARIGGKLSENPYTEKSELHWQWLDAWAMERPQNMKHAKQNDPVDLPPKKGGDSTRDVTGG